MLKINPRFCLLFITVVIVLLFAVACDSPESQADVALAPTIADEGSPSLPGDDGTKKAPLFVVPTTASEIDAASGQPESPIVAPQFSPLTVADTASWASAIASRRTLSIEIPEPKMGNIRGRFVADTPNALVFLTGDIYLAPVVFSEGEVSLPFISLNIGVDPIATEQTADGEFVFQNVKPGLYGLVLYTAASQYLALDAAGNVMYFQIEAGQTLELDDILIR